jgi:hypothetical protein
MPALKPTKFITNAAPMAELLQKTCKRDHEHQQLVSGRCANAAFYPIKLIRTMITGIRNTKDLQARLNGLVDTTKLDDVVHAIVDVDAEARSKVDKVGGGHSQIQYNPRNSREFIKMNTPMRFCRPI